MKQDKVLSLLGLSRRAGKLISGADLTVEAVRRGVCHLVVIAGDASAGSRKRIEDKCRYRNVPFVVYADRETLGACLGQNGRSCAAVCDRGLAEAIQKQIKDITQ